MIPPLALGSEPLFRTLSEAVERLETGVYSCRDLVESCLKRIDSLDPLVNAWVRLDAEGSLAAAKQADDRRSKGQALNRLDGIPFGVKDIIDVAGWPTVAGFEPWRDRIATRDAAIVAEMRRVGMIPIGKTVTTQFASIDPPRTRNPWNLERTPGGSSSGSCVAVACRMVPVALGSQTGGSINRPASFCGVAGLKLAFGAWPVSGVVPCAERLDTLGPIVPWTQDLPLILDTLFPDRRHAAREPAGKAQASLRILKLEGRFRKLADPVMNAALDRACDRLADAGHAVETDSYAAFFDEQLWETHRVVMMSECFWTHRHWFADYPDAYLPKIRSWVETGADLMAKTPRKVRAAELAHDQAICAFERIYGEYDALLVPAARGPAPLPDTTGDPVLNAPWTLLGVPSLTVPVTLDDDGLPLGIQLVAPGRGRSSIETLVRIAQKIE
jgi:Asp-tRNA(Asn)/Glu-tRNA(Gln) amidotransferase A subunit family amidase